MAAYLGYTLRMKTLFRGGPIMVHDTPTRRRRKVNKTIFKPRLAAAAGSQYVYMKFSGRKILRAAVMQHRRKQSGSGIRTIIRIGLKS